jgi:hypothetical protein
VVVPNLETDHVVGVQAAAALWPECRFGMNVGTTPAPHSGHDGACRSRDRGDQQVPQRCRSHRASRRRVQPSDLFPVGRAGELSRCRANFSSSRLRKSHPLAPPCAGITAPGVCDPYIRLAPETKGRTSSPKGDFQELRARREATRPRLAKVVRSSNEAHHDRVAGEAAALVLASRGVFGKQAA